MIRLRVIFKQSFSLDKGGKNQLNGYLYEKPSATKIAKNISNSSVLFIAIIWANLAFSACTISSEKYCFKYQASQM